MNQHDPTTTTTPTHSFHQQTISHSSLFDSEQPRSPIPTKRRVDHENGHDGIQGSQVNLIVTILGSLLNTSRKQIKNKKGDLGRIIFIFIFINYIYLYYLFVFIYRNNRSTRCINDNISHLY